MAAIIRENRVGFNNNNGDVAALVQNIERFMEDRELLNHYKENALTLTREKGDSAAVYGGMLELFADVADRKSIETKS
jgi:hypothetical protein